VNKLFDDLIIFEMANNHQGDTKHADYIIRKIDSAVRKYNLRSAVKFQYRDLDTLVHPDYKSRADVKHIPRFYATRLTREEFSELVYAVKERGMHAACTPFDEISVDICIDHGIDILKIASCSATDYPLLEKASAALKPIIVSTGGKSFSDMDKIYNFFTHRQNDIALLHCVGIYPVVNDQAQLNCIDKMINRYPGAAIGYSGHEDPDNTAIVQMAVAKGAGILERHVGHKTDGVSLNAYSTEVDNIENWIEAILAAKEICGPKDKKRITETEMTSLNELARGCYCAENTARGEKLQRNRVFFAMPCLDGQTTSGEFQDGMTATRDYKVNEPIFEKRKITSVNDMRSIIHDVKGMLYEAKVVIGNEFELELSHHCGMEHFRRVGATIVNIVNREYCKKIIVILAGQKHPMHYHKIKEETFQVLSGVLNLQTENGNYEIKAGEIFTVERSRRHAFTSASGCIFEEISTTHVANDSFYEDPKINQLDVTGRKTILRDW
jgi:N-acetylneuraminate synthase